MAKKVAFYGISLVLALILGYIERIASIDIGIPGVKIGLANIAALLFLYLYGVKSAYIISISRICISALLFGNIFSFAYSAVGGLLALAAMALAKKCNIFSIIGISVVGGVFHNIGQTAVASAILRSSAVLVYLPLLTVSGVIGGIIVGILTKSLLKLIPESYKKAL